MDTPRRLLDASGVSAVDAHASVGRAGALLEDVVSDGTLSAHGVPRVVLGGPARRRRAGGQYSDRVCGDARRTSVVEVWGNRGVHSFGAVRACTSMAFS